MGKQWKAAGKKEQAEKKGSLFTRLAKEIQVAVRLGGALPENNPRLQMALNTARAQSMPKSTIERAIERGRGHKGEELEEVLYEGFGPQGIALVLRCLTDNRTRTVSEIRHLFKIHEGQIGNTGSVLWMFDKVALRQARPRPEVLKDSTHFYNMLDFAEHVALEVEAEDVEPCEEKDFFFFYGKAEDLQTLQNNIEKKSLNILKAELAYKAKNLITIEKTKEEKIWKLLNAFEDHPDCQSVYTNLQIR